MKAIQPGNDTVRVVHIINSLEAGGAELLLLRLLPELTSRGIQSSVIALSGHSGLRTEFEAIGVPVIEMGLSKSIPGLFKLHRLPGILRAQHPQVVQTWLYHSDLLGGVLARWANVPRIYWNIRHSKPMHRATRFTTRSVVRINARLSGRLPNKIVCCAQEAAEEHAKIGFSHSKLVVIDNGFDTEKFAPDLDAPARLRQRLNVASNAPLIGLIARYHPLKGHHVFIAAARLHAQTHPDTVFVLCGYGVTSANEQLVAAIANTGLSDRFQLLGEQPQIESVQAGLTLACSSSVDEGFSNTLAEAMACGVPCVATNVGAAAAIMGDTGWLVDPDDSAALAAAWSEALLEPETDRKRRAIACRERIVQRYGLVQMGDRYARLYQEP